MRMTNDIVIRQFLIGEPARCQKLSTDGAVIRSGGYPIAARRKLPDGNVVVECLHSVPTATAARHVAAVRRLASRVSNLRRNEEL